MFPSHDRRGNNNTRKRHWVFTINNPAETGDDLIKRLSNDPTVKYCVFQLERGENNTPHHQGYIIFNASTRFNTAKDTIGGNPHIEGRRGSVQQAIDYCKKTESRVDGPWECGEPTRMGQRSDLLEVHAAFKAGKRVADIADAFPVQYIKYHKGIEKLYTHLQPLPTEPPYVVLLYGRTGTGKTRTVMSMPDVFKKDGTDQWFDMYAGDRDWET